MDGKFRSLGLPSKGSIRDLFLKGFYGWQVEEFRD